jgi:hypothetical protein
VAELSDFGAELFEEAKRFLERAHELGNSDGSKAFLHAALLLGFAAFEAHVNAAADDFLSRTDLSVHERGLLSERAVELIHGEFRLTNTLRIQRIDDRVLFLCRRFSNTPIDRRASFWGGFQDATKLRNRLTHPKGGQVAVSEIDVERALSAIVEFLNAMCLSLYRKKLPAFARGLASKKTF